jgi:hypothetical protein
MRYIIYTATNKPRSTSILDREGTPEDNNATIIDQFYESSVFNEERLFRLLRQWRIDLAHALLNAEDNISFDDDEPFRFNSSIYEEQISALTQAIRIFTMILNSMQYGDYVHFWEEESDSSDEDSSDEY